MQDNAHLHKIKINTGKSDYQKNIQLSQLNLFSSIAMGNLKMIPYNTLLCVVYLHTGLFC